jgi:predicted alpha/beta hydrolase
MWHNRRGRVDIQKKLGEKAVKIIIINVCCDDDKDKTRAVVQKIYSC